MLQVTDTRLRRLYMLRGTVPFMRQKEDEGSVDFENWSRPNSCGTVRCWAGWLTTLPEFNAEGLYAINAASCPAISNSWFGDTALKQFFSLTENEADFLFGESASRSFEARAEYLEELIAEVEEEVMA